MNENNWQKRGPYKHMPKSLKKKKYIYIYIYRIEFKLYHMQIIMIQILTTYGYNL